MSNTLLDEEGFIDENIYGAAITAKYPSGTEMGKLVAYVEEFKGSCKPRDERIWCEFPYKGGLCWAAMVGIDVVEKDGFIDSTSVEIGYIGC